MKVVASQMAADIVAEYGLDKLVIVEHPLVLVLYQGRAIEVPYGATYEFIMRTKPEDALLWIDINHIDLEATKKLARML